MLSLSGNPDRRLDFNYVDTVDDISEDTDFQFAAKARAWGVHGLTAFGAVAGLLSLAAITQYEWKLAFAYMMIATAIDSIDGTLARKFQVKIVLPGFDGALLDNLVDYFTFVIVPAVFIYMADLLPPQLAMGAAAMISLVSAYQFCQADAKTDDNFFKGFPSYWNIVALYLFLFQFGQWINLIILAGFAISVFVPILYVYPSRTDTFRKTTLGLSFVWSVAMITVLVQFPNHPPWLLWATMGYVAYYFSLSFYFTALAHRASTAKS
jgi:phosphatidylcholine synthase